jgi:hypothetical protein
LTAALKPWRQYAWRHAFWQALDAGMRARWFRFAKMPARIQNVAQPIDNISLFQLQCSVNPVAVGGT